MSEKDDSRVSWKHVIGRSIQIFGLLAAVNAARDTDWPTWGIALLAAACLGFGEGVRES